LPACGVEIRGVGPFLTTGFEPGPVAIDHGEPGRVAILSFHDHMLAEDAFEGEAETQGGPLPWFI
jgi:hypothetical protein